MNRKKIVILAGIALMLLSGAAFASGALKQKVSWTPETFRVTYTFSPDAIFFGKLAVAAIRIPSPLAV